MVTEYVENLITKILADPERMDMLVDHDFELSKPLTRQAINYINSKIEGKVAYKIISCEYSLSSGDWEGTYATPYFVYTENIYPQDRLNKKI